MMTLNENKTDRFFFGEKLVVTNIGIRPFFEDLKSLNVKVTHVEWEPPAGGDTKVTSVLDKLLGR
jgi:hypothetical protein